MTFFDEKKGGLPVETKKQTLKDFRIIYHYLKNKKIQCVIYVLFVILETGRDFIGPFLWGFALESLLNQNFQSFILFVACYQMMHIFFSTVVYNIRQKTYKTLEIEFMRNITQDLYEKIDQLPAKAFEEIGVGEFINRLYHDPEQVLSLLDKLIYLIVRSFVAIFAVGLAFYISIVLGIEVIVFAIIMGLLSYRVFPKIKKLQKEIKEDSDQYLKTATENITGIREIKSLGMKQNIEYKLFQSINAMYTKMKKISNHEINYYSSNNGLYYFLQLVIFITCGYYVVQGKISYALFITMESYLWRIDYVVESLSDFGVNFNKVTVSINRMADILYNRLYQDEHFGTVELENGKGEIEFKNVKFRYDEKEEDILKGINMTLFPHRKIAIIGKSGNGKTTLFNLLLRYFDATTGEIKIDGIPIEDLTEKSLRHNISVIRQTPFLFNMSFIDNFKLVKPDATLEAVRKVCKKAYIDDYIMSLPQQYDTVIGEGGVNLSGGQKQRIAIARTLLLNTKIILFDEATSALDNESQEYIKKTIDDLVKDHTVIIVAHRLSTIVDADEIHIIDKGNEVACGTHKELLKTSDVYQKLYRTESSN